MNTNPTITTDTPTSSTTSSATTRRPGTRFAMGAIALTVVAGLAACGSDSKKSSTAAASTATSARTAPAAVCDGAVKLGAVMGEAPQDPAAIKDFATTKVLPVATSLAAALPSDLTPAGNDLVAGYKAVAATADPGALEAPAMANAQSTIGEFVHRQCPLAAVDVTALDYSYAGLPDTLRAGRTSFKLINKGKEDHEMVILRRNDGVTEDFEALSKLPQDQMFSKVTFTGVAFGKPGSTSFDALDLSPGTYFLMCSMPVGGKEGGAPHFTQGMQRTITVAPAS